MKCCEEYAALLDPFVDGELTPEEMERVREHLEDCPGCRAYVDDALAIRAGFPEVEETVVPEGFVEGVMEQLRLHTPCEEKAVERKWRSFRRWMGTAAAMAACCALVVLVKTGSGGAEGVDPAVSAEAAVTSAYDGGEETGVAPRIALDAGEPEEHAQVHTAAKAEEKNRAAERGEDQQRSLMAAAPQAAAESRSDMEDIEVESYGGIALCLTAEEAGDLLDGFEPEWEDAMERRYTLRLKEYEMLLEELGRWEKLPEASEMSFQVVVTGPFS
ncbi:MAG: hypothetical protein HFG06_07355 [Oscillibacter sp.]|nr:hypothetical protein [Oscillibacter sp.]